MTRRAGLTLVEVLVSIFVMAIGLIALLTLFPIGVLQMAQAIRQENCLRAATMADSIATMMNVRNDPLVVSSAVPLVADYFTQPLPIMKPADPYGPSYAVMVDPQGFAGAVGIAQSWVGGIRPNPLPGPTTGGLIRRPTSFTIAGGIQSPTLIKSWFSRLDDVVFDNEMPPLTVTPGMAKLLAPQTIMREGRFTWTYVLQRPRTGDTSVVNCTIVVFESRPVVLTKLPGLLNLTLPEYYYGPVNAPVAFNLQSNTITIQTAVQPPTRPGDWLYDATIILPDAAHPFPEIASAFYRVVAVDQIAAGIYQYEVQQPLRSMTRDPQRLLHGTVIALDGVSEVFERGPMRMP